MKKEKKKNARRIQRINQKNEKEIEVFTGESGVEATLK
jgi:hypothetical protein